MAGRVVVVGLGPAGPDLLTERARAQLDSVPPEARFTRTDRHPAVGAVGPHASFDEVYEGASTLDEVYGSIVERLVEAASRHGRVVYAVPGSPLVAERTVELLRLRDDVEIEVEPCLSFLDLAWACLGVDPLASGVRLVDGQRFATEAAGERGPLLVAQCDSLDVLSEVKLAVDVGPEHPVTVLQRLGLPGESVHQVAWDDLDREVTPDHLTTLWIPELRAPVGAELVRFHDLVATLRRQCPWDRQQTHTSLRRYLLEESYEVLDALDRLESGGELAIADLEEELGDLLFQVYFHAEIAGESGWFTLADVAQGIHDKLVRRHPHVFGDTRADDAGAVVRNWDRIKQEEKAAAGRPTGPFDSVPRALPALAYTAKLQRRAAGLGVGFATPEEAWADVAAELAELQEADAAESHERRAAELGDVLFAVAGLARHQGVDPEEALREAAGRFRIRVEEAVRLAAERGQSLAELDGEARARLWSEVKARLEH
ncbi:MAG: tetrapyrrole methylase family protein / MazG family protein [Acidimicrobiia bacterium]|nr:tetrapyrrole methylase family protein / MazG family protein [Acidimicrobiia bacterium]